ncbi:FAD-dependent tricarballylate dehydrogenase TcuA [Sulfitobacter sp. PR48]|uniref:FAD-dependent tricarballylate dehydrogenase TcuA n=1 Tax=Sulfitobacter sp. PR48 TaxID=3028383 RepID=UPI00237A7AFF|nr:FAD-dependent tricarballylate dehydrogenase TcuA [Sulfitobacter sp. PR48]MDD9720521.1 FAD-dependent tricarballylate dehydrogenase TcuA [Sulfitobacter sp. PR48]
MPKSVIVVGTGNAALCAAIAALEKGAQVLLLEKADEALAGGNTKYTAGAMRFAYQGKEDLMPLLRDPEDPRLDVTDFGSYTVEKFSEDLLGFNDGRPLSAEQQSLVTTSGETMKWLATHDVTFEPIYSRQSFEKDGRHVFWGGLTLAARNEGVGLFDMELAAVRRLGGKVRFDSAVTGLLREGDRVTGVKVGEEEIRADAVILASGGFEASEDLRVRHMGPNWKAAKVRGTPHNTGDGLTLAMAAGAEAYGLYSSGHATPMDLHMADFGNLDLAPGERKNYRKICYFLGVMVNAEGNRFVDEGANFRNYTYAQYGAAILDQPGQFAWQVFDSKVFDLLYAEYRFDDAHFVEADTLEDLAAQMTGVDGAGALATLQSYNAAVDETRPFDPTRLDGKGTPSLALPKSHWAQKIDTPPFRAYPVTGGITFTYGGLKVNEDGNVMRQDATPIAGLYACGELVGGVFFAGYPGGSGLTSGAVFGRRAGYGAALS